MDVLHIANAGGMRRCDKYESKSMTHSMCFLGGGAVY